MKEQIKEIREACIKAIPEIVESTYADKQITRPIRLADVLLILGQVEKVFTGDWVINTRGHFVKSLVNGQNISQSERWDLLNDNLESQSEETISFIHSLIK